MEDLELGQDEKSETMKDREEGKQNEVPDESKTEGADISIVGGGGDVEMPPDTDMQIPTVNKAHRTRNGEKEVESAQSMGILEYIALNNATERILNNEDVPIVQEDRDVYQIGETDEIKESSLAISENVPKSGQETELLIWGNLKDLGGKV